MRIVTPVEVASQTGNKYLGVLVAAKFARFVNDFPRDRSVELEKKLTTRAMEELVAARLTALLLARTGAVLCAPAMNDAMFAHPATRANLKTLAERGWTFVGPETGALAEGPSELPGRMSEPETILAAAARLLAPPGRLKGKTVLVTAGPTREHLDPVRVITNPSSGRMGYALAEAAFARGAEVILVVGPTDLPVP